MASYPHLPGAVGSSEPDDGLEKAFLGGSEAAGAVRRAIRRAALMDAPVLIVGESGVGKEIVARGIHVLSRRKRGPFVPVNCAAIPETLVETELFGHVSGAYTDAHHARRGAFELAHGGTLFLDEVGDCSPIAQPKLLRAIEAGEILPVGAESPRRVDFRLIAATNQDLRRMSREGRFRSDLFYRLQVIEIVVPPLRERTEDIGVLADHFAKSIADGSRLRFVGLTPEVVERLEAHSWPGNVRELRSVIERALMQNSGGAIDVSAITIDPPSGDRQPLRSLLRQDWPAARRHFESMYASDLLTRHAGDVENAARAAGVTVRSLYKMLHRLGLRPGSFVPPDGGARRGPGGGGP